METAPIKILFVDEDPWVLDSWKAILATLGEGFEIYTISEASRAMNILEEKVPDICIIELYQIGYPCDGIQILQKAKEVNPNAQCLMAVFHDTPPENCLMAYRFGAFEVVDKIDMGMNLIKWIIPQMVEIILGKGQAKI